MAKSKDAPRKPHTHFEQVPLDVVMVLHREAELLQDVVKKFAEQDVSRDKKDRTARVGVESTSRKKG